MHLVWGNFAFFWISNSVAARMDLGTAGRVAFWVPESALSCVFFNLHFFGKFLFFLDFKLRSGTLPDIFELFLSIFGRFRRCWAIFDVRIDFPNHFGSRLFGLARLRWFSRDYYRLWQTRSWVCVSWCCGGGHVKWCHEVAKLVRDRHFSFSCLSGPKMRRSRRRAKSTVPVVSLQISLETFFQKNFQKN